MDFCNCCIIFVIMIKDVKYFIEKSNSDSELNLHYLVIDEDCGL